MLIVKRGKSKDGTGEWHFYKAAVVEKLSKYNEISEVLNRIIEEKIKAIVVAPESTATWWYNLKDLSIDSITLGKARKVCNRGKQKLPYIGRLEAHLIDQRDR